jgi:hypothetical protein
MTRLAVSRLIVLVAIGLARLDVSRTQEQEQVTEARPTTLKFVKDLKNLTKEAGDSMRLRCEVTGSPPATSIEWLKNGVPLVEEKNRIKVRTRLKDDPQSSLARFRWLETLDTAFYSCKASNGIDTIESMAIVKVKMGKMDPSRNRMFGRFNDDDDYDERGLLPESYGEPDFSGSVEFEGGQQPPSTSGTGLVDSGGPAGGGQVRMNNSYFFKTSEMTRLAFQIMHNLGENIPNLKPNERSGTCQPYIGTVCSKYIGNEYIFVSRGLSQTYIEQKLQAAFAVISASPDLSDACSPYAIPSICLSTFPLCDKVTFENAFIPLPRRNSMASIFFAQVTEKPRKLCREECEILENTICRKELAIARQYAALERQLVLPECHEIPPIGSPESANCVRLFIPEVEQLIKPHNCYNADGSGYRGTISNTESGKLSHGSVCRNRLYQLFSGLVCIPWNRHPSLRSTISDHLSLIGGHNFCRSPEGLEGPYMSEGPWCFASSNDQTFKETCNIPKCNNINMYLYIAVPASVATALLALCLCICCIRRGSGSSSKDSTVAAKEAAAAQNTNNGTMQSANMELNSLLPPHQQQMQARQVQLREFPINALKFIEELGEGKTCS